MSRRKNRSKRGGIPRVDLQARRVSNILDERNRPVDNAVEMFTAENCTVQPASGADLLTLPEGYRDAEVFNIFTDTALRTAVRGTDSKADEVYLSEKYTPRAGYFTVIQSKAWQNGVIDHYHVVVVRANN